MSTEISTEMRLEWQRLLGALQGDIADDYRCTDDPDDTEPGMCVTIGYTPESEDKDASWSYQTGDNSFTGGAYGQHYWAVVYLYRDSDIAALAYDAVCEIEEQLP